MGKVKRWKKIAVHQGIMDAGIAEVLYGGGIRIFKADCGGFLLVPAGE